MWRMMHLLLMACALVVLTVSCNREEDDQPAGTQDPGWGNLRLALLPLHGAASVTVWLDDTMQVADLRGPWVGPRHPLRAGDHHATLTVQADEPTEVFDQHLTLPAGGEYTYVITGVGTSWRGYLIADSCLRDTVSADSFRQATIRLVNVHASDTVTMGMEYMRLMQYAARTPAGQCADYAMVFPWNPLGDPTYHISLGFFEPGHDVTLPVDSLRGAGVYSVYTYGADPDLDPTHALRGIIVTDYPPLP